MENRFTGELWDKLEWMEILIFPLLFVVLFLFLFFRGYLLERKERKLKYDGMGVLKKTKVSVVGKRYVSGDEDSSGYYVYRLESKDEEGNLYKSGEFSRKVEYGGRTLEEMVKKYDGVVYDLGNKDESIKKLNEDIERLGAELQNNPGFFKKWGLKRDISTLKKYINIAKEGPITPYLIINGHKISVGDGIDVYVNPEKTSEYYVDLDFTKQN